MPVTPTYPGVYIEEVPSGVHTITGVATSITAFIGYTAKGPVNKAVQIFNQGDYERNFGGLHRDSLVSYAVRQFFLNGGTNALIVRVAAGATAAKITLKDPSGTYVLVVSAANEGRWGNSLRLDVDYNTSNPDSTFNLVVTRYEHRNGALVAVGSETFRNLSMNSRSSTYAINVVNSASQLIRIERDGVISFVDRGFSLSGNLSSFSGLTLQESTISGILDGSDPFTLVLTAPLPVNIAGLVTAINSAITTAGLSSRLGTVERATAIGVVDATGNYIKLTSRNVPANPNTATEFSSVQITKSPSNDASAKLGLGLTNGGREKEGGSSRRPAQTGTTGADLADILGTNANGNINVVITDNSTGTSLLPSNTITLPPSTQVGPPLATKLQELIRDIANPAAQQATVQLNGTFLRVIPSAATPNASIALSGAGATATRLTGLGSFINIQHYSLGTGVTFGAQIGAVIGNDGTPPGGTEIIGNYDAKTGIYALRDVDIFNIMCIPETTVLNDAEARSVIANAISFCEEMRAFYIVDYEPSRDFTTIAAWVSSLGAQKNAAVFFPRVKLADPMDGFRLKDFPSSGTIAGLFARIDMERGVWKAPAGTEAGLQGGQSLSLNLTDPENGVLNQKGINCLRTFPAVGNICWGARTLEGSDALGSEWKYIPIRRLALFLEESLFRGTKWVVFEPNDEPLWSKIRLNVGAFMMRLFRQGAFQGSTPDKAFYIKCDAETTTQADRNLGIVNIEVGFAPLKPAEFVIIKIQQMAGEL